MSFFLVLSLAVGFAQNHPLDITNATDYETYAATWETATLEQVQNWLANGGNVTATDDYGESTAFGWAVQYNQNAAIISALIQAGGNIRERGSGNQSLLALVVQNNPTTEVLKLLLEAGADINDVGGTGGSDATLLMIAASGNPNPAVTQMLIEAGADIHARKRLDSGNTALMEAAAFNSNPEVIKALLNAGAYIDDVSTYDGSTALIEAVKYNRAAEAVLRFLLEAGANPNIVDYEGRRALDYAAERTDLMNTEIYQKLYNLSQTHPLSLESAAIDSQGYFSAWENATPEEVQAWLQAGADVNASDERARKAILAAASNPNPEVMKLVLGSGADVNTSGYEGGSPLLFAVGSNNSLEVIQLLIEAGADVNESVYGDGGTVLTDAAYYNENPEVILALIRAGAVANLEDGTYHDALRSAARGNKNKAVISTLLEAGAELNATSFNGWTALMDAAASNNSEIVTFLLDAGANATAKDYDGKSALDYAKENPQLQGTAVLQRLEQAFYQVNTPSDIGYAVIGDMSSFEQTFEAYMNGRSFVVEDVGGCLMLEDIRDFNGDGHNDALVLQLLACGGNAMGSERFFVFYDGQTFRRTEPFGYSYIESILEPWENGWIVTTIDSGRDDYDDERVITERTILRDGQAVLVESRESQELPTLIELRGRAFQNDSFTPQAISYDLNLDGTSEVITCEYWDRWSTMNCTTSLPSAEYVDLGSCVRIGVLATQTNGVHDLVCGDEKVLTWQNSSYQ